MQNNRDSMRNNSLSNIDYLVGTLSIIITLFIVVYFYIEFGDINPTIRVIAFMIIIFGSFGICYIMVKYKQTGTETVFSQYRVGSNQLVTSGSGSTLPLTDNSVTPTAPHFEVCINEQTLAYKPPSYEEAMKS